MKPRNFLQSVPDYLGGKIGKNQSVFHITVLHPIIWGMQNANPNDQQYQSFPSRFQVLFQQVLCKKKKSNYRRDIILPQATADLNHHLYKTGQCLLFIVGCILDLGSCMSFSGYDIFGKSVKDGDCGKQSPNSCPPVDKRHSLTASPRLEFLEENKMDSMEMSCTVFSNFWPTHLQNFLVPWDLACLILPQ